MLHLGTLAAVAVAMRKSLWQTLRHPIADKKFLYLLLASVPTFAIALTVKLFVSEELMKKLLPVGFAATIVLITLSDKLTKPHLRLAETSPLPAVVTGIAQGIAVFPGLSRSGTTISTMKFFGVNATDSAEFSFLLSIPIILGSAFVEIWEIAKADVIVDWACVAVGVVAAFASGMVSVYAVMRALKGNRWIWFAVYLLVPLIVSLITL